MPGAMKESLQARSSWFNCLHARPEARARLICLPWCGGGSQYYARWGADFKNNIEVIGVRLPGRETRFKEDLMDDLSKVVSSMCDEIVKHYSDKPFALFGHSMGAILCYEAAAYLKQRHGKEAQHLFFSAEYAPHSKVRKGHLDNPDHKSLHDLTDTELIDRIGKHGGTPKTFLENTDFMVNTFLPPYKNDLRMISKYQILGPLCDRVENDLVPCVELTIEAFFDPGGGCRTLKGKKPFSCGITAIDGDRDTSHFLSEYSDLTTGRFHQLKLPGGHFYLLKEENCKRVRDLIMKAML